MRLGIGVGVVVAMVVAGSALAKPVTADDVALFKVGTATIDDVEAKLGKPQSIAHNSDGTEAVIYLATSTKVKGATFIPYIGLFAGGAKSEVHSATFTFDASGVLKSTSSTDTSTSCNAFGNCH